MIKRLLRNLRKKPKAVRNQFALFFAGTVAVFTAFVWASQLPNRLFLQNDNQTVDENHRRTPSLAELFDVFKKQTAAVKEAVTREGSTGQTAVGADEITDLQIKQQKNNGPVFEIDKETIDRYRQNKISRATGTAAEQDADTEQNQFGEAGGADRVEINGQPAEDVDTPPQTVRIITVKSSTTATISDEQ